MIDIAKELINQLNKNKIKYCHWKSNIGLEKELDGGELDFYVTHESKEIFQKIIESLGFIRVIVPLQKHIHNVFHYYGLDSKTGKLLHLHIFYSIVTGESLIKNYEFEIGDILLKDMTEKFGIPVPNSQLELFLFVIRIYSKHLSYIEYLILLRDYKKIHQELAYLEKESQGKLISEEICERYFNNIPLDLIYDGIFLLKCGSNYLQKYRHSRKINKYIRKYNRYSTLRSFYLRLKILFRIFFKKIFSRKKFKHIKSEGFICAITGPEATGKSTLVKVISNWIGCNFLVYNFHIGKPPSSVLTLPINIISPLMKIFFQKESNVYKIKNSISNNIKPSGIIYSIKSILLAYDRLKLSNKMRKNSKNGAVVISDRWPSPKIGSMDSPRIIVGNNNSKSIIVNYLSILENKIYKNILPPDLIISLVVSPEIAEKRNQERVKKNKESTDYVLKRHNPVYCPDFSGISTVELNTDNDLPNTIISIKNIFWENIVAFDG